MAHPLSNLQQNWIKQRYSDQEPLNIHAVLRADAEIIHRAYYDEKPWGWRRILLSLDIDPYGIEHELQQFVSCQFCQEEYMSLSNHLRMAHGVSNNAYQQQFPSAQISSEFRRSQKALIRSYLGIEHWELLWSPHYVLDFIIAASERGEGGVYHLRNGKGHNAFVDITLRYFGTWKYAVKRAGVEMTKPKPSKEEVIQQIREVVKDRKKDPSLTPPTNLVTQMRREFGSKDLALKAAGVSKGAFQLTREELENLAEQAVIELRNLVDLKGLERRTAYRKIWKKYRVSIIPRYKSFRQFAVEHHLPLAVVSGTTYRDEADIHHDLDLLEAEGKDLTPNNLRDFGLALLTAAKSFPETAKRLNIRSMKPRRTA